MEYYYDGQGNVLRETDNLSQSAYYSYDDLGNMIRSTDKNGVVTSYVYDGLNRLVKESNGIDDDITYTYDNTVSKVIHENNGEMLFSEQYGYDKNGNKVYAAMDTEITEYTYDQNDRLTRVKQGNDYVIYEFDS